MDLTTTQVFSSASGHKVFAVIRILIEVFQRTCNCAFHFIKFENYPIIPPIQRIKIVPPRTKS